MAVQHTHRKEDEQTDADKSLGRRGFSKEKTQGLYAMVYIRKQPKRTAARHQLNKGVVPTRREEGTELFKFRKVPRRIVAGVERVTEDRVADIDF